MKTWRTIDLTYGAIFVCLMAIGANITVWFPILAIPIGGTSVPLSLQTFFAILAGLLLGKRLASLAVISYILIGVSGIPVFAGLTGGPFALISPTGGFIISFVFTAYVTGWMSEKLKSKPINYFLAAVAGLIVNYVFGVTYMYLAMNTWLELEISYFLAWLGMFPFLIKDAGFALLGSLFAMSLAKRLPNGTLRNY